MRRSPADAVFVVTYGGGHAAAVAPVVERLHGEGVPVCSLALTTARQTFERRGLPFIGVADLQPRVDGYRSVRRVGRILARAQPPHSSVPIAETESYLGASFHSMVREHGLPSAKARYARLGRQSFRPVDFFLSLFRAERPAVVVATSAPRAERAALEAARELGIKSLCLVDLYAPFEIEWCAEPDYASTICVLNQAVSARFQARGVPAERIVVTGNPAFDRLNHVDYAGLRRTGRAARGLAPHDSLVVWISQPEPAIHPFSGVAGDPSLPLRAERHLAAHYSNRKDVHLVMRLHPSEDRPPEVEGQRVRYSSSAEPLDALLCAADCVVTASSTVGLEAAMLGVPVVQCMDSVFSEDLPLARLGVAQPVDRCQDAGECVDKILRDRAGVGQRSAVAAAPDAAGLVARQVSMLFRK